MTFNTQTEAEDAVKEVQKAGFDMKKLSIVGKDYHSVQYEISLKANKFLLIAHGSSAEVEQARRY